MSSDQKRDADMDRLLRAALKPPPREAAGACPDADVLAAFSEGGLTATEQSALDSHVARCGRCQEALAILSHDLPEASLEASPTPQESKWFTWVTQPRLRWLVPISAAATVAVIFFATRPLIAPEGEAPGEEVTRMAQVPPAPAETPQPSKPTVDTAPGAAPVAEPARDKKTAQSAAEVTAARVVSEEKAAPVAGAYAMRAQKLEAPLLTVPAPGGNVIWRFGARGRLSRSADAGDTWHDQASGTTADLLAGAAPAPAVCWIVGAAGTVLLTTDGERWERRPFPEAVDLVAVAAASGRAATVTTRDGGRFETRDGGLTWSPTR